jgi:hypothetical protein
VSEAYSCSTAVPLCFIFEEGLKWTKEEPGKGKVAEKYHNDEVSP